jgi:hypothetical protein
MSLDPPTNLWDSIFFLAFMFDDVGTMVKNFNDGGISTFTKNLVEKVPGKSHLRVRFAHPR